MEFNEKEYYNIAEILLSNDVEGIKMAVGIICENTKNIPWEWLFTLYYITPPEYDDDLSVAVNKYKYRDWITNPDLVYVENRKVRDIKYMIKDIQHQINRAESLHNELC